METILVVDDEAAIRGLIRAILTAHGFRILTAGSGAEAIRIWGEATQPIDLLITDLKMPGMDGRELAREMRRKQANLKVLYMSGFAEEIEEFDPPPGGHSEFLEKPFSNSMLVGRVVRMVAKSRKPAGKSRATDSGRT